MVIRRGELFTPGVRISLIEIVGVAAVGGVGGALGGHVV
jgi:hypothetical protein